MSLKLMYITNSRFIASVAERVGVDWIFIDLEKNGKAERQGHLDTVISNHSINDIKNIKSVLDQSKLLVRVNPIFEGSKEEINNVIDYGADIVMLPFFSDGNEVSKFINLVAGRAETCLLVETPKAVENIDYILEIDGIDYIHIGLNDLHLGYKMDFMFELLANGTVERLADKIKKKNIKYGFGGIASLGKGDLPAEYIIAEHYRLKSELVILSRSFCNVKNIDDKDSIYKLFTEGVSDIRNFEEQLSQWTTEQFSFNKNNVREIVHLIINKKRL